MADSQLGLDDNWKLPSVGGGVTAAPSSALGLDDGWKLPSIAGPNPTTLSDVQVKAKRIGHLDDGVGSFEELSNPWPMMKSVGKQLLGGALDSARTLTGAETQQQAQANESNLGLPPSQNTSLQNVRAIGGILAPAPGTTDSGSAALSGVINSSRDAAVSLLKKSGVDLDRAQQTAGKWWQTAKNIVTDSPFVGDGGKAVEQSQQFTKAALSLMGETSSEATPSVMGAARTRLGDVYNTVLPRNAVNMSAPQGAKLLDGLADIEDKASGELNDDQMKLVQKQINNLLDASTKNGGSIPGRVVQTAKQTLDRLSMGADSSVGHFARDIREQVMDALQTSASPEDAAALTKARTQWRYMEQISGAIDKNNQIPATALFQRMDTLKNAQQSVYGKGNQDLMNLAQSGARVLPDTANSGTTRRILSSSSVLAVGGAIEEASRGDYKSAVGLGLLGFLGPAGLRYIVQHPEFGAKVSGAIKANLMRTAPRLGMAVNAYQSNPQQGQGQNQVPVLPQQGSQTSPGQ